MGKLEDLFGVNKPIIGMIHLAPRRHKSMISHALEEMRIYEGEGVSGVIVEDYHQGISVCNICNAMKAIRDADFKIVVGVNVLQNPIFSAVISEDYGGKFVQYDTIQGDMFYPGWQLSKQFVMGGVGFKYQPKTGNPIDYDLKEGMNLCDAIVTTGDGTGIPTPMGKLVEYKSILKDFPLIVGAGVNPSNVYDQLQIADGAIVGSCFKQDGDTYRMVDRRLVRNLMTVVETLRK